MRWSRFPPRTREVQFDEKWSFVGKKEGHCEPDDPLDVLKGDPTGTFLLSVGALRSIGKRNVSIRCLKNLSFHCQERFLQSFTTRPTL